MAKQRTTGELSVSILNSMNDYLETSVELQKDGLDELIDMRLYLKELNTNTRKISTSLEGLKMNGNVSSNSSKISENSIDSSQGIVNAIELASMNNLLYLDSIQKTLEKSLNIKEGEAKLNTSLKEEFASLGMMAGALSHLIVIADRTSPKASSNIKNIITNLITAVQPVIDKGEDIQKGAMGLSMMSSAITSLGYSLALATPLYLIGSIGAVLAGIVITGLSYVFASIDSKSVMDSSLAIQQMGKSILYLGASVALFSYLVTPEAMIETSIGLLVFGGVFMLLGQFEKTIDEGAKSLTYSALSIVSLGLGIAIFGMLVQDISTIFAVAVSVLLIGGAFWLIGKAANEIAAGSKSLIFAGLSIASLGLGIYIFKSFDIEFEDVIMTAISIGVVGLSMAIAGKFASNIFVGALAMTLATIPIILLGYALNEFKKNEIGAEDIGILSLSLVTVGSTMALAGAFAPIIAFGAIAMLLAGLSIVVLTYSLGEFKKLDWKEDDSKNLNLALSSVRGAFTGGDGASGGLLSSIGGFFSSIFDAGAMIASAAAMMVAASAISNTSKALTDFKKVSWTEMDSTALTSVFASITKSFSILSDKKLQKEYGIDTSPEEMFKSVLALSSAGFTLSSLAQGVGSFAKLTFDEWELDESTGKLKVVKRTKLSSSDLEKAGLNISQIISVVGSAFAEVGKLESGGSSPNSILESVFGGGFVSSGVFALSGAGSVLSTLAEGVKNFASLSFTEYEVQKGKIVPKKITKMSDSDITSAGTNISRIISVVGAAFAEVGKLNSGETSNDGLLSSIFGGGGQLVRRGVESLSSAGGTIVSLAQGVKDFASLNIVEYGIVEKDGLPTLVPISTRKMSDSDFESATTNISRIVSVVGSVFAEVGRLDGGEGSNNGLLSSIFGGSLVGNGVAALSGVGENLNSLAEAIPKYASLSFVKMKIQDIDGKPTLVPGEIVILSDADLAKAGMNIAKVLGVVAMAFSEVGKMADEGSGWFANGYIDKGVSAMKGVGDNLSKIVDSTLKVASMQIPILDEQGNQIGTQAISTTDILKAGENIKMILSGTASTFYNFGMEYGEGSEKNEILKSGLKIITSLSGSYSSAVEGFSTGLENTEGIKSSVDSFGLTASSFITNVLNLFDPTTDPNILKKMELFNLFTDDVQRIAENGQGFSTSATSMEKFSNSVKVFKDNLNSMDLKKLTTMDSMFNSLAHLAKIKGGIDTLGKTVKESIDLAFTKLIESVQEVSGGVERGNEISTNLGTSITKNSTPVKTNPDGTPITNTQPIPNEPLNMIEIEDLLRGILDELRRGNAIKAGG